jgi:hypothetical protein
LSFDAEGFEGVPEFVGLRGAAFAVAITCHHVSSPLYLCKVDQVTE